MARGMQYEVVQRCTTAMFSTGRWQLGARDAMRTARDGGGVAVSIRGGGSTRAAWIPARPALAVRL